MRTANVSPLLVVVLLATCPPAEAQEWTRFRGPNGAGVSDAASIPLQWTEKDFNWQVALPGIGHSSPVLWGQRLFLTAGDNKTGRRYVLCHDVAEGKQLWKQEYDGKPYKMHLRNSVATATPAVDEGQLTVSAQASIDRIAISRALVELGWLSFTRQSKAPPQPQRAGRKPQAEDR